MSEPIDKPRCVRIIQEWEEYTNDVVLEQSGDKDYKTPEQLLEATAETHADLRAMKCLREQLERDCE
jgi:hypothetical protein